MFGIKKLENRIADLETFERGICKIIDGYFKTNEQVETRYSMDNAVDKFWHFVNSVDDRLKMVSELETKIKEKDEIIKDLRQEKSELEIMVIAQNRANSRSKNESKNGGKK